MGAPSLALSRSARPTSSSTLRAPSRAMIWRSCPATKSMNRSTYSGLPAKRLRSSGSCVAMPKGQVPRWQTRIMRQPMATSGAVAKLNSSAPSSRATATSWPLINLPVCLQGNALAQVVAAEHLMRFGQPDFPGQTRVVNAARRRGPGAALAAGDENALGPGLGHAAGDGAHAAGGNQLDGDARLFVGALQVIDQFGQVLNGVDVVVRRRGDEGDARRGAARPGHVPGDLCPRQVSALAGFRALGHLNLDLLG